jgi:hypothetical protein
MYNGHKCRREWCGDFRGDVSRGEVVILVVDLPWLVASASSMTDAETLWGAARGLFPQTPNCQPEKQASLSIQLLTEPVPLFRGGSNP